VHSQMLLIPVGAKPSFSLTPAAAFAVAGITFLATLPFAARGIFIERRPVWSVLALCLALLSLPLSFHVMHRVAAERHITFGE
jgi:hypothetical protein